MLKQNYVYNKIIKGKSVHMNALPIQTEDFFFVFVWLYVTFIRAILLILGTKRSDNSWMKVWDVFMT